MSQDNTAPDSGPVAVFETAQQAMAKGDWLTFFDCLDRRDLKRLLKNSISLSLSFRESNNAALAALCQSHGFPLTEVAAFWGAGQSQPYQKVVEAALQQLTDWPGFMAALEQHTRHYRGGGSVSSSLFVGEQLRDVEWQGTQAHGIRQITADFAEPVGFVYRKRRWYIRLFVRRP